jgi:DNA primase
VSTDAPAEIKARLDILDVIGGYVSLHRSGTQHVGLCPFHAEKTPSFSVSQQRQAFYCHGCTEGGDIFTFVQRIEGVDFPRALEILAERAGVELEKSPRAAARGAGRRRSLVLNDRAPQF